ncbi:MAG: MraY family glycosyltransferase [Clostridiales bacterium]
MLQFLLASAVALVLSLLLTPVAKWLAPKIGAVDAPNERKVHSSLMPRMGGVAIFAAFAVGAFLVGGFNKAVVGLVLSSGLVMLVGLVDDIKNISPKTKLLGQLIAAIIFVSFGGYVKFMTNPFGGNIMFLDYWGIPLTILWLMGISNAINLIDGLDGLAAGVSAISAITMATVSFSRGYYVPAGLAFVLAMSLLGFLKYNFSPAQIFMGDSGSLFLGFVLGALAIMGFSKGATVISLFIPILILGIPIFDTMFAIVRRYNNHVPIFQADKGHLHHCLLALGLSHKQTVLIIYAITLFMGLCAILLTVISSRQAVLIIVVILVFSLVGADKLGVLHGRKKKEPLAADGTAPQEKEKQ